MEKTCIKVIESKLEGLKSLTNPVLPKGANIHIYELVKKGKGWSTVSYRWNNVGRVDPYCNEDVVDCGSLLKGYSTLSQIKKSYNFEGNLEIIPFVIDGNLFAPSKLYQVIIECNEKSKEFILSILKKNKGEMYECLLDYKWLDDISSEKIKELQQY